MEEKEVREWFIKKVCNFPVQQIAYATMEECIDRIRAIADEAELRLSNPNWPSNE